MPDSTDEHAHTLGMSCPVKHCRWPLAPDAQTWVVASEPPLNPGWVFTLPDATGPGSPRRAREPATITDEAVEAYRAAALARALSGESYGAADVIRAGLAAALPHLVETVLDLDLSEDHHSASRCGARPGCPGCAGEEARAAGIAEGRRQAAEILMRPGLDALRCIPDGRIQNGCVVHDGATVRKNLQAAYLEIRGARDAEAAEHVLERAPHTAFTPTVHGLDLVDGTLTGRITSAGRAEVCLVAGSRTVYNGEPITVAVPTGIATRLGGVRGSAVLVHPGRWRRALRVWPVDTHLVGFTPGDSDQLVTGTNPDAWTAGTELHLALMPCELADPGAFR